MGQVLRMDSYGVIITEVTVRLDQGLDLPIQFRVINVTVPISVNWLESKIIINVGHLMMLASFPCTFFDPFHNHTNIESKLSCHRPTIT